MTVTPTCRFCQRKMRIQDNCRPTYLDSPITHTYWCQACQSCQILETNGRIVEWSFIVANKYSLYFIPGDHFSIYLMPTLRDGPTFWETPLLKTKSVPFKMTPQNTTEERIRLLILFS